MPKRGRRSLKKIEARELAGVKKRVDAAAKRTNARSKAASKPKREEERSPSLVPTEVYAISDAESERTVLEDGGDVQSHVGNAAAAKPTASRADEPDAVHAATEYAGPATNVSIDGASGSRCPSKRSIGTDTDSLFQ